MYQSTHRGFYEGGRDMNKLLLSLEINGTSGHEVITGVTSTADPETVAIGHFSKQGYVVARCQPHGVVSSITKHYVLFEEKDYIEEAIREGKLPKELNRDFYVWGCKVGVPDLFCYKDENDWFFVEVKGSDGGLRYTQLAWLITTKLRTKLVFVINESKISNYFTMDFPDIIMAMKEEGI